MQVCDESPRGPSASLTMTTADILGQTSEWDADDTFVWRSRVAPVPEHISVGL